MQLRQFYNLFLEELKALYSYEEASAITNMVFEHFAHTDRTTIITQPGKEIEQEQLSALENALLQLKRNIPVQYIIGHAWFAGHKFEVNPAVLIPRPETEELVMEAVDFIKKNNKKSVLDIGTGSGCIPISIKKQQPATDITAIDISEEALAVAGRNALYNNAAIHFIRLDFLREDNWSQLPQCDVIISNPPYIPETEKDSLDKNVTLHEPHLALFVPDNQALIFYERIAAFGLKHLATNGCIFMETHEALAQQVARHFEEKGYEAVIKKDFFEKERMVIANRSH
ncbi:MAG: peptide chain release factor N(5)-glutamine methyltransferase [Sphingobacteriales bacterium]|nr:MAG: peptide chain release factor N(5)-glutamine methyltransferase [Sphingobacteriales bacterium]